jgi:hypothetical protein
MNKTTTKHNNKTQQQNTTTKHNNKNIKNNLKITRYN